MRSGVENVLIHPAERFLDAGAGRRQIHPQMAGGVEHPAILNGDAGVFIVTYYYLSFNHLIHVFWGLLGMIWVMLRTGTGSYSAEEHSGLESFAVYWHTTDIIWLMIFPLFYVLR